jgi:diguanylate cyclase (GGDEF)-like protein/PAS domain S-box-containing protein
MDGFISQALLRVADAPKRPFSAIAPGFNPVQSLERLLDGVPYPVLVKDRAHRWLLMNDAWCALMRRPREELLGHTDHDLVPADQADGYTALDDEVFATGEERQVEESLTLHDGVVHILQTRKRLVTLAGPAGDEGFVIVSSADITAVRRTEAALREGEERYRAIVELSPLIAWSADPQGMIIDVAERWYKLTGLTPEQTLGGAWVSALNAGDLPEAGRKWAFSVQTGKPFSMEYRYRLQDGSYCWVHARATALRDDGGRIIRWYGTLEDIHDRKLAEQALRESELRFRAMADDAPVMIWVSDETGACSFSNRLWYETTGQSEADAQGLGWLEAIHPDDRGAVEQAFTVANARHEYFRTEYRLRRAEGGYAWVIDTANPRFAPGGTFLGYIGSVLDISERRAMEMALRESETFARSVLESSPNCIRVLDLDGRVQFMNEAGHRLLETGGDAVAGQGWGPALPAQYADEARRAFASARAGHSSRHHGHRMTRSGAVQWLDISVTPIPGADDRPARLLSIWHDVTEVRQAREAAEQARREAEAAATRLSSVLESTMDSVVVLDRDWRVTYLNGNAERAMRDRNPRIGLSLWEIFPDEAEGIFARNYRRAMEQQVPVAFEEYVHALGCWLEVHAYPAADGISIFFRDVTERRKAEQERLIAQERIAHMARHDGLTSLPNRIFFREQLERALLDSRHGARAAVHYLDLDGFKAVNDTLGHPAGDALLRQVADRLQQCVRGSDTVARFGGDEFAIIQTAIRSNEDADELARRIVAALSAPFELDGQQVAIGTSIGVAFVPEDGGNPDELLKAADMALYRAKGDGRGVHRFFEPGMDESIRARQVIKLALREALARDEFELHYQPLINLGTGAISCFEALLRWRHPERGMVSPADFIPVAEETGLIIQIGEWALREACRQAVTWPSGISVAVNLSPVQFRSRFLVDTVRAALTATGLEPCRLQLEITESVLLQDDNGNLAVLQDLRRLGIRIAMDDFGTGYSSLGYLRSFPFDKIKLDRSFVGDLPHGAEARAIVRAVAGLGAGLCITTTAEGIETAHQLAALRKDGYNEGQGFLFSRPVQAVEALRLVQAATQAEHFSHI